MFPSRFHSPKGDANVYTYVVRQKANKTIAFLKKPPVLGSRKLTKGSHTDLFHSQEKRLPAGRRNTQFMLESSRNGGRKRNEKTRVESLTP